MDAIAALKAKRAQILANAQREAEALDADARELERAQAIAAKYGLELVEKVRASGAPRAVEAKPAKPEPTYRTAITVSETALRAAGAPLELSQLFDACQRQGVPLAGKRPQSTLSAYLAHDSSTVESIRRGIYWLRGVPVPGSGESGLPPRNGSGANTAPHREAALRLEGDDPP